MSGDPKEAPAGKTEGEIFKLNIATQLRGHMALSCLCVILGGNISHCQTVSQ